MSTAPRESRSSSGISFQTLLIASASSLAAAIFIHKLWQGGAILGAAITPIIVGIVGEALRRPAERLTSVREGGRRLPADREEDVPQASRERGDDPFGLWDDDRRRRSRGRTWLVLGVVTGVIGFAVAAFVLTGSELALGGSVSGPRKTTIFGGGKTTVTTVQTVVTQTQTQTTPTPTVTQTVPAVPPATTQPAPTTQTVPPRSAVPEQGTPTVPTAPAPTPDPTATQPGVTP